MKALKKLATMKAGKKAVLGIGAIEAIKSKKSGDNNLDAAAKSTIEMAAATFMSPPLYLMAKYGKEAAESITKTYERIDRRTRDFGKGGTAMPFTANTFVDNKQLYTMRQSSMAMIQQSKYLAAEAMRGSEASFMHK